MSKEAGSSPSAPRTKKRLFEALLVLSILSIIFGYLGHKMGPSNMINTMFKTAHELILNTIWYIMGITVLSGALGKLFNEFHITWLMEHIMSPLMKPLYRLPGRTALAAIVTFFSDNPAIISMAKETDFAKGMRPWQLVSLTNFGTAFGCGMLTITFMGALPLAGVTSSGTFFAALIGFVGAIVGSIISTRLMQWLSRPDLPDTPIGGDEKQCNTEYAQIVASSHPQDSAMLRALNAILDGGKSGVELAILVIPGVVIICTLVMMFTFGPSAHGYDGQPFEGVALLPYVGEKISWLIKPLFGFKDPAVIAFPITAMGSVGAALALIPSFIKQGMIGGNEIAIFTAVGMCWSGFLSTHTSMLDALNYRPFIGRALLSHTIAGILAGIFTHFLYVFLT